MASFSVLAPGDRADLVFVLVGARRPDRATVEYSDGIRAVQRLGWPGIHGGRGDSGYPSCRSRRQRHAVHDRSEPGASFRCFKNRRHRAVSVFCFIAQDFIWAMGSLILRLTCASSGCSKASTSPEEHSLDALGPQKRYCSTATRRRRTEHSGPAVGCSRYGKARVGLH